MIHRPGRGRPRRPEGRPEPASSSDHDRTYTTSRDAIEVPRTGKGTLPPEGARAFAWDRTCGPQNKKGVFPLVLRLSPCRRTMGARWGGKPARNSQGWFVGSRLAGNALRERFAEWHRARGPAEQASSQRAAAAVRRQRKGAACIRPALEDGRANTTAA